MSFITGKNLSCIRGMKYVYGKVDFTVDAGEILVVVGKNGCGKTSLLKTIAGFLKPSSGQITISCADDLQSLDIIHYIGTSSSLKKQLTVRENLTFWSKMLDSDADNIDKAIKSFGLDEMSNSQISYLSSGQIKRCSLARLLLAERKIWILDEPETALDNDSLNRFIDIVTNHVKNNGIAIIASHRPDIWPDNKKLLEIG